MSMPTNVLLLIGSPRADKSTSVRLARLLAGGLSGPGITIDELPLTHALRTPERRAALLARVDQADLLVLAAPVYVDSLPAPVIAALELLAEHWRGTPPAHPKQLAAIANCGFPEASHCAIALRICEQFARETGTEWLGGIAVGAGGMVNGMLDEPTPGAVGKPMRGLWRGMADAATALRAGQPIPAAALARIARPAIPHRLYTLIATINWYRAARDHQAIAALGRRPYAQISDELWQRDQHSGT